MATYFNSENMPLLMGVIAAAIIVAIAAILLAGYFYFSADSRKIKRIIKKYGNAYEREIIYSNGVGGYFFIDYLVLLPGKILALNLKTLEGSVFGGEGIELWTLVGNTGTSKFRNPLEDLNLFVNQVADQLQFDGVIARVLFDSKSKFPKGVPEDVLQLASFRESMAAWAKEKPVEEASSNAWDGLSKFLAESRERYKEETSKSAAN